MTLGIMKVEPWKLSVLNLLMWVGQLGCGGPAKEVKFGFEHRSGFFHGFGSNSKRLSDVVDQHNVDFCNEIGRSWAMRSSAEEAIKRLKKRRRPKCEDCASTNG